MSEFQCFRTVNQALHDRVRNLTDINWPEIYVFMESNAFLVLESELDYRIIPKGRVKFVMNCFVNSSASKESDGLCNSLFPNSSHRVTGMHSQGNSHRRRAHWGCAPLGELSPLCTVPPPPGCQPAYLRDLVLAPSHQERWLLPFMAGKFPGRNVLSVSSSLCNVEWVNSLKYRAAQPRAISALSFLLLFCSPTPLLQNNAWVLGNWLQAWSAWVISFYFWYAEGNCGGNRKGLCPKSPSRGLSSLEWQC